MCAAHSKRLKYSLTQQHKAQEHKQQVTSYELLFLGILCVFYCVLLITFQSLVMPFQLWLVAAVTVPEKCKNLRNYILSVQVRVTLPVF